ncbi:MAG: thioredoxin TrxC [Bdellovibrionales bacterium]|nr:thioredoxin TrxC [Bdellovibrionales bacterium]
MDTLVICPKCGKSNRVPLGVARKSPICGNCKTDLPLHGAVQEVDFARLRRLVEASDRPVVVDFWASWCGPCRIFAPTFAKTAELASDRFVFAKLNTEESPEAAQAYGIRGIPTLIVFKDGREVDRQSGAIPETAFVQYLNRWA